MINLKNLYSIFKEVGKINEYKKILSLQEENINLKKKNEDLILKLEIKEDVEFRNKNNAYYKKSDGDGPFCQKCYDKDNVLARLIPINIYKNWYECNICKNKFNITGKEDPLLRMKLRNEDYS